MNCIYRSSNEGAQEIRDKEKDRIGERAVQLEKHKTEIRLPEAT